MTALTLTTTNPASPTNAAQQSRARVNPAFCPTPEEIDAKWAALAATPYEHPRTVIVLCGWRAPLAALKSVRANLKQLMPGTRVVPIAFPKASSMKQADEATRSILIARGLNDTPIDVVAISMGGLIARSLGAGTFGAPIQITNLFTFATPHRGAVLARYVRPDSAARDMRPGSTFLRELDVALDRATFDLTPYGYLRDWWVGCENTAPPGRLPHWLDPLGARGRLFSHFMITTERRIILDVALRLRGMPSISAPAPLPNSDPLTPTSASSRSA